MLALGCNASTIEGRVVGLADGDNITVLDAEKTQHKVRLSGIDAPETSHKIGVKKTPGQPLAIESKNHLNSRNCLYGSIERWKNSFRTVINLQVLKIAFKH